MGVTPNETDQSKMSSTNEREAYNVPANEPRKQATKSNLAAGIPTGFENVTPSDNKTANQVDNDWNVQK